MSARRFRLEAVLRVRRIQEEAERGVLRRAHAARDQARLGEEEALQYYGRVPQTLGQSGLGEFMAERASAQRAAEALGLRRSAVAESELTVAEARRCWTEAASRVSMLERLEDRHRRAHEAARDRREVLAVEELATARSARSTSDSGGHRP